MIIVIAASRLLRESRIMNEPAKTIIQPENQNESTYALLVRSEEKSRSVFEVVVYPLLILGPLIAIWQFAQQPVNIPVAGWKTWVVSDASVQNSVWRKEFHGLPRDRHPDTKG
jgi:hypothetical protein